MQGCGPRRKNNGDLNECQVLCYFEICIYSSKIIKEHIKKEVLNYKRVKRVAECSSNIISFLT